MNKNKVIAFIIFLAVFFGPFYYLFIRDNGRDIVDSALEMFMMLGWIIGMIVAFGIAVNEPFGKKSSAGKQQKNIPMQKSEAA